MSVGKVTGTIVVVLLWGVLCVLGASIWYWLLVKENSVPEQVLVPVLTSTSREAWESQREQLLSELTETQYGIVPTTPIFWEVKKEVLNGEAYNNRAAIELWTMAAPSSSFTFHMVVTIPHASGSQPALLASNFCPNHTRYPQFNIPKPTSYFNGCDESGMMGDLVSTLLGTYINTYPFETIIDKGLILATMYLGEGAADDVTAAAATLETLGELTGQSVTGTIAGWAWTFNEMNRVLEADTRIDAKRTSIYGHSRDGKAALLAAAHNKAIDLTIAHQSGKGGAAPWQRSVGESYESIMTDYPHWFTPTFTIAEPPSFDQHQLVAAVAPRPLLLSTAWLDNWSDPTGTFRVVHDATPIYELYGAKGVTKRIMRDAFVPTNELAFYIRPLNHGVRQTDWDNFLQFIDYHFGLSRGGGG